MYLTYERKLRPALLFAAGFLLVTVAVMTWPAIDPGLRTFFDRSIGSQTGRSSPFSIWGQTSLEPLRTVILAGTAGLSLLFVFVPRRKSLIQLAALSAALLISLQLTLHHWFYLYIVWFFPLLLVALTLPEADRPREPATEPEPSPARTSRPVPAR
jgi:uncharacterized BrkB/YihY/UPF0761 family membrane protein